MKAVKISSFMIALVLMLAFLAVPVLMGQASAQTPAPAGLSNVDCAKCHAGPPADIAANGGKHKEVGCTACHPGHRPEVKNNIPQCSQCHMGKPHFELKGCLGCHRNPHTPRKISFAGNVTDACLTCHTAQIDQLREHKSKHTALYCSTCHDVHGKKPACTQCHKPHAADMTAGECTKCHKAHMPKAVTYASDIPSQDCGACHAGVVTLLASSKAKHNAFACAFCHQEKHKMIPRCQDCHGEPHPAGIMAKFPKCGDCHNIAHDLNHWPSTTEKKEAVKEGKKEVKKKK